MHSTLLMMRWKQIQAKRLSKRLTDGPYHSLHSQPQPLFFFLFFFFFSFLNVVDLLYCLFSHSSSPSFFFFNGPSFRFVL